MPTNDEIEAALRAVGEMRGEILRLKVQVSWLQSQREEDEARNRRRRVPKVSGAPAGTTFRDIEAMRCIRDFQRAHGRTPLLRELADALGMKGTTGVSYRIQRLRRLGLVSKNTERRKNRIEILWDPDAEAGGPQSRIDARAGA